MLQVRIYHMATALSKTFKSPVVDTIQSLPQHQQVSYIYTTHVHYQSHNDVLKRSITKQG